MRAEERCEEVRGVAAELALGIAAGEERARALEHLAACPACAREVGALSELADELLLLAPAEEPAVGFETRTLSAFATSRQGSRRRRVLVGLAAAVVATATIATGATLLLAYRDDRDLAAGYRATLAEADGVYLGAADLVAPDGEEAGHAFGYQGSPSWILVTAGSERPMAAGTYDLEVITRNGERMALRPIRINPGGGSSGQAIDVDFHEVAALRMLGPRRGDVYEARFDSSWGD